MYLISWLVFILPDILCERNIDSAQAGGVSQPTQIKLNISWFCPARWGEPATQSSSHIHLIHYRVPQFRLLHSWQILRVCFELCAARSTRPQRSSSGSFLLPQLSTSLFTARSHHFTYLQALITDFPYWFNNCHQVVSQFWVKLGQRVSSSSGTRIVTIFKYVSF